MKNKQDQPQTNPNRQLQFEKINVLFDRLYLKIAVFENTLTITRMPHKNERLSVIQFASQHGISGTIEELIDKYGAFEAKETCRLLNSKTK